MPEQVEPQRATDELPHAPRSIPPWIVDALAVLIVALVYLGFLASQLLIQGPAAHRILGPPVWTTRTIIGALVFPSVFSLWWRRPCPRLVLAIALGAMVVADPFPGPFALTALVTAGIRLPVREALIAWVAAALSFVAGRALSGSFAGASDMVSAAFNAGLPLVIGQWVGARRAYVDRLREGALLARALASFLPPEVAQVIQASPNALSLHDEREATVESRSSHSRFL